MPRNFSFAGQFSIKDPRVTVRAILGVLLLANLVAAGVVFKPFGGSAEDLLHQQQQLRAQLSQLELRLDNTRKLVNKVKTAREAGDMFLSRFFLDEPTASSAILQELNANAVASGIVMGQAQWNFEQIEGSDTLQMLTTQVGFEGTYANLTKFVNLLDKSPRFLIIENLQANAPQQQGGQKLNVTLKIDTFVRDSAAGQPVAGALP